MKISAQHAYSKNSTEVFALFSGENYHVDKFTACGSRNVELVERTGSADEFSVTTAREVPADVPGVLKSLIGEWNSITQTEEWQDVGDDEFICDFAISTEGVPVEITGTMNLMPEGDGCVNHIEMEISCSVPLLGKKLAQFVAKDGNKTLAAEYAFNQKQLG